MKNFNEQELLEHLLSQWQPHKQLTTPPPTRIPLWNNQSCFISIGDDWGPPIPYPPMDHRDGHHNHGYVPLKERPDEIAKIPEVQECPELQQLLELINAPHRSIESAGCEKWSDTVEAGEAKARVGCYVDILYSDWQANEHPENLLLLASRLVSPVEECGKWWGQVNLSLCRLKHLPGTTSPWGLELHVNNFGRTEEEARKLWAETIGRLGNTIAQLPKDLKWIS